MRLPVNLFARLCRMQVTHGINKEVNDQHKLLENMVRNRNLRLVSAKCAWTWRLTGRSLSGPHKCASHMLTCPGWENNVCTGRELRVSWWVNVGSHGQVPSGESYENIWGSTRSRHVHIKGTIDRRQCTCLAVTHRQHVRFSPYWMVHNHPTSDRCTTTRRTSGSSTALLLLQQASSLCGTSCCAKNFRNVRCFAETGLTGGLWEGLPGERHTRPVCHIATGLTSLWCGVGGLAA